MITNADCTIYHKIYNPETRLDEWEPSQHQGVNWYGTVSYTHLSMPWALIIKSIWPGFRARRLNMSTAMK